MNPAVSALRDTLAKHGLLNSDSMLLCACSGGADSVALLYAAVLLREETGFHLKAIHIQHGLRGEDSIQDEKLVRTLCSEWGVPLSVRNADLAGDMHTPGIETLARERRYSLFEQEMNVTCANALLLAHHADDQAETLLMHLFRGAGLTGMAAVRESVPFAGALALRPFLFLRHQELCEWLSSTDIPWREDQSNTDPGTPRNAIRMEILPKAEALYPGTARHIASACRIIGEEEAYLEKLTNEAYGLAACVEPPFFCLKKSTLLAQPPVIRRRMLRKWYTEGCAAAGFAPEERSLSYEETMQLDEILVSGREMNLPGGFKASSQSHALHLLRQNGSPLRNASELCIAPFGKDEYTFPAGIRICVLRGLSGIEKTPDTLFVPLDRSEGLAFRYPRADDMIHPLGAPGRKALRRFLTDRKIDPAMRPWLPILADGSEILWIPGLCTAESMRVTESGVDSLILTCKNKILKD